MFEVIETQSGWATKYLFLFFCVGISIFVYGLDYRGGFASVDRFVERRMRKSEIDSRYLLFSIHYLGRFGVGGGCDFGDSLS